MFRVKFTLNLAAHGETYQPLEYVTLQYVTLESLAKHEHVHYMFQTINSQA